MSLQLIMEADGPLKHPPPHVTRKFMALCINLFSIRSHVEITINQIKPPISTGCFHYDEFGNFMFVTVPFHLTKCGIPCSVERFYCRSSCVCVSCKTVFRRKEDLAFQAFHFPSTRKVNVAFECKKMFKQTQFNCLYRPALSSSVIIHKRKPTYLTQPHSAHNSYALLKPE